MNDNLNYASNPQDMKAAAEASPASLLTLKAMPFTNPYFASLSKITMKEQFEQLKTQMNRNPNTMIPIFSHPDQMHDPSYSNPLGIQFESQLLTVPLKMNILQLKFYIIQRL
mmetsp:Transcript_19050/g.29215  ORF Transcript_19050/g.29215 Transcript_19050/m.29215 type:complete len:112 (+) Transcript_19050:1619-1954(+)